MKAEPVTDYLFSPHAVFEMKRRGLNEEAIQSVLAVPEQRFEVRPGRDVLQSRLTVSGKIYLVRVFVDVDRRPAEVVTVYRTSKISKYWREGA